MEMRYQKILMAIVTLAMAVIATTGTAFTDQFPQATQAESVGFDALAHQLFAGSAASERDEAVSE